jgi:uncharacterized protein YndB with AHSA1/START domain
VSEILLPIVAEISIDAPIAHVWEVLTSERTLPEWLGCINYRREVGTTFHMQQDAARRAAADTTGATFCDVALLEAPHKFNFTWYVPGTPATLVRISLFSEGGDRTFVRLSHEGWDQFPAEMVKPFHDQLKNGWSGAVLPNLKQAAERKP